MTRITNFGRKRTYVQAGFTDDAHVEEPQASTSTLQSESHSHGQSPPTKKRKRTKKPKVYGASDDNGGESARSPEGEAQADSQRNVAPKNMLKGQRKTKGRSTIANKCRFILKAFSPARSCPTLRGKTPEANCRKICRHDLFCMSPEGARCKGLSDYT